VKAVLLISHRDNVATALEPLDDGRLVDVRDVTVRVIEHVPPGHKVALVDIPRGAPVIKYGSPIGTAIAHIAAGAHVHTHNLSSARGRGDLVAADHGVREPLPRLAEPDERNEPPVEGPAEHAGRTPR
jgi:altronate dehydratase